MSNEKPQSSDSFASPECEISSKLEEILEKIKIFSKLKKEAIKQGYPENFLNADLTLLYSPTAEIEKIVDENIKLIERLFKSKHHE